MHEESALRLQSAVDYLVTYGWALVIITIMIAAIYFLVSGQLMSQPTFCTLSTQARCTNLAVGANSIVSKFQIVFVNGQEYSITNPSLLFNISSHGNYNPSCSPNYVLPGGIIICSLSTSALPVNSRINGLMIFKEDVCRSIGTSSCQSPLKESINGTYSATVSPSIPTVSCAISLSPAYSSIQLGTADAVNAVVTLSDVPIASATVNFTVNPLTANLNQEYMLTNPNGTATIYVTGTSAGTVSVTGNFLPGCSASTSVTFT
ncbi:MAG: Ig-like domain-containing protein [Candidatus Marsarchaeota archaeon]|jgi:hypothetical protein|nr:Ig-like domain-containing protein [Candidatus Marsarchaeota archaeon]